VREPAIHDEHRHGERARQRNGAGSVFPNPLINHGGYTLWLEHVVEKGGGTDLFRLM